MIVVLERPDLERFVRALKANELPSGTDDGYRRRLIALLELAVGTPESARLEYRP